MKIEFPTVEMFQKEIMALFWAKLGVKCSEKIKFSHGLKKQKLAKGVLYLKNNLIALMSYFRTIKMKKCDEKHFPHRCCNFHVFSSNPPWWKCFIKDLLYGMPNNKGQWDLCFTHWRPCF